VAIEGDTLSLSKRGMSFCLRRRSLSTCLYMLNGIRFFTLAYTR